MKQSETLIEFLPFESRYTRDCLTLFCGNLSGYFSPDEVNDYRQFLNQLESNDHYYVGFIDHQVVACGGWDKQARGYFLRWGIIDQSRHKQGLGRQLLAFRIDRIYQQNGPVDIFIKTSDKAHGFFMKFGFCVDQIFPDGIYPGIDEYQMHLPVGSFKPQNDAEIGL